MSWKGKVSRSSTAARRQGKKRTPGKVDRMISNIRGHSGDLGDHSFGGVTEVGGHMKGPEE